MNKMKFKVGDKVRWSSHPLILGVILDTQDIVPGDPPYLVRWFRDPKNVFIWQEEEALVLIAPKWEALANHFLNDKESGVEFDVEIVTTLAASFEQVAIDTALRTYSIERRANLIIHGTPPKVIHRATAEESEAELLEFIKGII